MQKRERERKQYILQYIRNKTWRRNSYEGIEIFGKILPETAVSSTARTSWSCTRRPVRSCPWRAWRRTCRISRRWTSPETAVGKYWRELATTSPGRTEGFEYPWHLSRVEARDRPSLPSLREATSATRSTSRWCRWAQDLSERTFRFSRTRNPPSSG